MTPVFLHHPRSVRDPKLRLFSRRERADIADPIALQNHLFRGGRAPVCERAADFNGDVNVESDDANNLKSYFFGGSQQPRPFEQSVCAATMPWPNGTCAPLGFVLTAPEKTTEPTFSAQVSIHSPSLRIEGWSFSLESGGCTITKVSTDRTKAAEVWDDPPGLRHLGYSGNSAVDGGAISTSYFLCPKTYYWPRPKILRRYSPWT